MKPAPFEYRAPRSIDEILGLLSRYGDDCRILAGGQSLVPLLNMRMASPAVLISINHCEPLDTLSNDGTRIAIGARTRQAVAEKADLVRDRCRLLYKALPLVGSIANRNRGTICGSLAHNDPCAELPAVAAALDAEFVLNSSAGARRVSAADFFVSELVTCVEEGEYLESISLPVDAPLTGASVVEVGARAHGPAIAGVAAQVELDESGRCKRARLAGFGVGPGPVRFSAAEDIASGSNLSEEALSEAADAAAAHVDPLGDIHADAAYRKHLAGVLTARALRDAAADAQRQTGR